MGELVHFTVGDSEPKVGFIQAVEIDMQGKQKIKIENEYYLLSEVSLIKKS